MCVLDFRKLYVLSSAFLINVNQLHNTKVFIFLLFRQGLCWLQTVRCIITSIALK